ncbi:MAG: pyridoxamine 5'-phosphate oxidase family protein [Pseudomonadota bacterium]
MLTEQMKTLIDTFSAASVATVNEDGTPSVSPKATFGIIDDRTLVFGNIRSPGTIRNLTRNPAIELCFTDILARRALRVTGTAEMVPRAQAGDDIIQAYDIRWADYRSRVKSFVVVHITAVEAIDSPAYDLGATEDELRATNLAKLNALQAG